MSAPAQEGCDRGRGHATHHDASNIRKTHGDPLHPCEPGHPSMRAKQIRTGDSARVVVGCGMEREGEREEGSKGKVGSAAAADHGGASLCEPSSSGSFDSYDTALGGSKRSSLSKFFCKARSFSQLCDAVDGPLGDSAKALEKPCKRKRVSSRAAAALSLEAATEQRE